MKQVLIGILAGSCLTLACVFGYQYVAHSPKTSIPARHETIRTRRVADLKKPIKTEVPPSRKTVSDPQTRSTDDGNLAEFLIREIPADREDIDSLAPKQETVSGAGSETIAAIEALAQYRGVQNRSVGRDLQQKVEELKKKGKEIVPDLIKILQGSGPDESKIIAANVLGGINAGLQDPDISYLLSSQVIPMLQGIVNGEADMTLKRQAIAALGEIKDAASAKALVDVAISQSERGLRMYASRTLERTGTTESAYQLLPTLRNPDNDAEILLAANCIARINTRAQDPNLATELAQAVPRLQGIVNDAAVSNGNRWVALSALGAIGNAEANQILMELVKGGENVDEGTQRSTLFAISRSGGPDLAQGLGEVLQSGNDTNRQIGIASVIVSIANRNPDSTAATASASQAMQVLNQLASSNESAETQKTAISAIGRVGSTNDIETLRQLGQSNESLLPTVNEAIRRIQQRVEGGDSRVRFGRFGN
jgi:HEAT repeat protein